MRKIFFILFVYLLLLPRSVFAAGEFGVAYDVAYAIAPSGTTIVTQEISLTNKTTNLYPQQYALSLDSTNVQNVIAYDPGGVITPSVSQKDGKTDLLLTFNERIVGLGRSLAFTLRYEQGDIAQKNGTIWEVNVPGIVADPGLERYDVTLAVPPTFGPNAYLTPQPANGRKWTKEQMITGGISGAWGEAQQFDLTLRYHLTNPTVAPITQTITLPPDTAYQRVAIKTVEPAPLAVSRDSDGNWIASYALAASQALDITAAVRVQTFLIQQSNPDPQPIDEEVYLAPTKYWQVDSPAIQKVAENLKTPRDIYNYVVATLSYDYERVNQNPVRKGALAALNEPTTAVCMEFTDLFVALARAAGIPAREVIGYAYTTNSKLRPLSLVRDVLHAWPEYYDREGGVWIPVDPTWADTTGGVNYFDKLDFNHIAFVIHGRSSETPYPAGFFRKSGASGKDVEVTFANAAADEVPAKFTVEFDLPNTINAGFGTKGRILVKNTSGIAVSQVAVHFEAQPYQINQTIEAQYFPPLGTYELPLNLPAAGALTGGKARFLVTVNSVTFEKQVEIRPLYWLIIPIQVGVAAAIGLTLWFARKNLWKKRPPKT